MKISFFSSRTFRFILPLLCIVSAGCVASSATLAADKPLQTFELHDQLGHEWNHELLTYDVADNLYGRKDVVLAGPDGKALTYQWTTAENGKKQIAFLADLPKFGQSTYRLQTGAPQAKTDLLVEETADAIRLSNGKTGVAIHKKLENGQAPIAGVLLASSQWIGGSQLKTDLPVQSYEARVLERGPVFAEVLCTVNFGADKNWRLRLRVIAGEPVVLVSEACNLGDSSAWRLSFNDNFAPTRLYYRSGSPSATGKLGDDAIDTKDGTVFVLEPWLRWWSQPHEFNWLGLYKEQSDDLLEIAALRPGVWVDPAAKTPQSPPRVMIRREGAALFADLPLTGGVRQWLLADLPKTQSLQPLTESAGKDVYAAPLPQQYLIKYGDFPLNMVKDYVLQWQGDEAGHPRMLVTPSDVARFRQGYKADDARRKAALIPASSLGYFNTGPTVEYYLGTGDKEVGRRLADAVLLQMQDEVDAFFEQSYQATLGSAPHHRRGLLQVPTLADTVWSDIFTPAERERLKAQAAFLGYTVNRADFWSPPRGYSANPNMTTMVASYQVAFGSLLPDHPQSKAWVTAGMTELKHEADGWSDENGGWLEAPHYAMASFDYMLGPFVMAHNAGLNDYLYDPRLKKIARWFSQISTPPDVNVEGIRHFPPIGNTYMNEPSCEFGILASIWKEKDPQFAAEMQWMYRQQGAPPLPGVGGAFPAFEGYRNILLDPSIKTQKPDYKSTLFPQTGVCLRNGVDDRETQLYMIAGSNHAHYDDDSGSVTFWGKGRLIANDFGYTTGASTLRGYHNMLDSPAVNGVMEVRTFESTPQFDYVRGASGQWQRQIAFVKDSDMMAPNYFVLRDSTQAPVPQTWRMWFTANKIAPSIANHYLVEGKDDVDTDVVFAAPANPDVKIEDASAKGGGLDSKRRFGIQTSTQTGLIARVSGDVLTVIYPRLKTQKPPVVTSLAEGRAVKIEQEAGADYVFLSDVPFTYKGDGIEFRGTSGVVKVRGGKAFVALGEGGKLTAFGQTKAGPISQALQILSRAKGKALFIDFEDGKLPPLTDSPLAPKIYEGDPVAGSTAHDGKHCLQLTLPPTGGGHTSYLTRIQLDPTKKYRLSLKLYAPGKAGGTIGGYASSSDGLHIQDTNGQVAGWGIGFQGPTAGWQTLETTFGPPASGAKTILPPQTAFIDLTFWCGGTSSPIYVDDITVEEMK
jgi:hypothetical protein